MSASIANDAAQASWVPIDKLKDMEEMFGYCPCPSRKTTKKPAKKQIELTLQIASFRIAPQQI
jgi:hypothetical protein